MAVASIWRGAWMRPRLPAASTASRGGGGGGRGSGGDSLQPSVGGSTTSGGNTTTTTTTTSGSAAGEQPRDFHPFMLVRPTAPVTEEIAENLDVVAKELEQDRVKKELEHIKGLLVEFNGDNLIAVERWLLELDVGWVLHLAQGCITISRRFQYFAESWILALQGISKSICRCLDGWCAQDREEETTDKQQPASEFAQLVEATMLKLLHFVDAIIATARTTDRPGAGALLAEKLQVLIDVRAALSMALDHILSLSRFSSCVQSTDGTTMEGLLSANLVKLDKAIWDAIVENRNSIMALVMDDGGVPCSSSDIHKGTHSVMRFAKVLWANHGSVNRILHDAFIRGEYVAADNENVSHLSNLIMEMVCSLEEKLAAKSRSWFPDQGLRFLLLINNSYFMLQQLHTIWRLGFPMPALTGRIDDYIHGYLQASWAPVLKCLRRHPPTARCFSRNSSTLAKFESEFHKTYALQKLWKVPDPDMRKVMRKAIIDKVIPIFTEFVEHNSISTPGVITPRKVKKMLGELFEG